MNRATAKKELATQRQIAEAERSAGITRTTRTPARCPNCRTLNTLWHDDVCLECWQSHLAEEKRKYGV